LTWPGKNIRPDATSAILTEDPARSYGAAEQQDSHLSDNLLIFGDNFIAMKAIEADFAGKIKCIYADPPYNHGRVRYMVDGPDRAARLTMMRDRFEILYRLLAPDGLIWIHLDQGEVHYCRVLLDEIFRGARNFVSQVTYQRSGAAGVGQKGFLVNTAEYLLVYRKGRKAITGAETSALSVPLDRAVMRRYNKVLVSPGRRRLVRESPSVSNGLPVRIYEHEGFEVRPFAPRDFQYHRAEAEADYVKHFDAIFRTVNPQTENTFQGDIITTMKANTLYTVDYVPSRGRSKGRAATRYYYGQHLCAWLKDTATIRDGHVMKSVRLTDVWTDIPKGDLASEGGVEFSRGKKPEYLLKRIIELSSRPGDWVLDPFGGSGTTGAVAHKMGRRWVMMESGEQCHTHISARLRTVIDGRDRTGVTKDADWKGGGGFRYCYVSAAAEQDVQVSRKVCGDPKESCNRFLSTVRAQHPGVAFSLTSSGNKKAARRCLAKAIVTRPDKIFKIDYLVKLVRLYARKTR
jgi:adenine-specific DNA-methyltransferase